MKEIKYVINDPVGIHARPAGLLVKKVKEFESDIKILFGEKSAPAKSLMSVMALGVKCGNEITITVDGSDEEAAATGIEAFLKENL